MIEARWLKQQKIFRPLAHSLQYCDEHFEDEQVVKFEEIEEHSDPSRRHFFACVGKTWDNLKEADQKQYKSREHLRHWVVIQAGYYTCEDVVAMSAKQAAEFAVQIARVAQRNDPYAIVTVIGNVVRVYYAKSLKKRGRNALTKKEFQDMKEKALVILSDLIGTDVDTLLRQVPMPADDQPGDHHLQPAPEAEPLTFESGDPLLDAYEAYAGRR